MLHEPQDIVYTLSHPICRTEAAGVRQGRLNFGRSWIGRAKVLQFLDVVARDWKLYWRRLQRFSCLLFLPVWTWHTVKCFLFPAVNVLCQRMMKVSFSTSLAYEPRAISNSRIEEVWVSTLGSEHET